MPAAAVIPAPIAYIKVVAVKKLVVGFLVHDVGRSFECECWTFCDPSFLETVLCPSLVGERDPNRLL